MILGTDDAFSELGLSPDASESEVKAAWRKLVSQWHPDRNDSALAVARIQRINRAFEEIRNARQHGAAGGSPTTTGSARASSAATKAAQRDADARAKDKAKAEAAYKIAEPVMDRYATRGLIHKNKAARHKSRLTAHIKALA